MSGGNDDAGRIHLSTSRTHLFRGARLDCAGGFPGCAAAVRIRFGDGIEVDAELLQRGADEFALDVPAHRTAAGAEIAPKAWRIARIEPAGEGSVPDEGPVPGGGSVGGSVLVVGDRLA